MIGHGEHLGKTISSRSQTPVDETPYRQQRAPSSATPYAEDGFPKPNTQVPCTCRQVANRDPQHTVHLRVGYPIEVQAQWMNQHFWVCPGDGVLVIVITQLSILDHAFDVCLNFRMISNLVR